MRLGQAQRLGFPGCCPLLLWGPDSTDRRLCPPQRLPASSSFPKIRPPSTHYRKNSYPTSPTKPQPSGRDPCRDAVSGRGPPYLDAAISAFCLAMVAARSAASTARSTFSRILLARSGMRFFLLPLTRMFCLYLPSSLVPSGNVMQP